MKWPTELWLVRHGESAYNVHRANKLRDPEYREFVEAYDADCLSPRTRELANLMWHRYNLHLGDWNTPLTPKGETQARSLGAAMRERFSAPDVLFCSPHERALHTLRNMCETWPELEGVRIVEEPRLHEQDHGLAVVYNDWKIFTALHQEQKQLHDITGDYWYRFPQGENMFDVVERMRSFIGTLVRDYSEMRVGVITHHTTLLSFIAAVSRWTHKELIEWDTNRVPINCGVTIFRGDPTIGDEGRFEMVEYNLKLYAD